MVESVVTVAATLVIVEVVTMSVDDEMVTVGLVVFEIVEDLIMVVVVEITSGVIVCTRVLVGAVNVVLIVVVEVDVV